MMSALMAKKPPLKGHHLGAAARRDSDPPQLTIEAPALIRASGPITERESRAAGGWPGAGRRWCGQGRRRRWRRVFVRPDRWRSGVATAVRGADQAVAV